MTTEHDTRLGAFLTAVSLELPAGAVVVDPDITLSYAHDQSRLTSFEVPAAVLMPRDTGEVSLCLRLAAQHGVPVIARGAGTGLSGAANAHADAVVLSLHRMNAVLELDVANRVARVQPGVITGDLRSVVAGAGLFYPPDPGSVASCTIGGNVATNAGGMCCVRYGVTGDFVLGLEVVLADGRVLRTGRRTLKGVAGYDLTHLFVGAEGTLGVVTEVTVKLVPAPPVPHTLVATFGQLVDAGRAVEGIVGAGVVPSMLEILDRTTVRAVDAMARMGFDADVAAVVLVQCSGGDVERVSVVCEEAGAVDIADTDDAAEGDMLLEARRLALPALERLGDWLLDDVCVPVTAVVDLIARIEEIADAHGLTIGVFGHAGDGNLHPTIIFDESDPASRDAALACFNAITGAALELGGTVTGEHGVGSLKRAWLQREQGVVGMDVHRAIKDALDPRHLLCPNGMLG